MTLEETLKTIVREQLAPLERHLSLLAGAVSKVDERMSRKEAAAFMGVDVDTITDWIREGILTRYGHGKIIRISKQELLSLKEASRPKAANSQFTEEDISAMAVELMSRDKKKVG